MIIRHLCGSSDLIDLEYKNHLLLGSIVVDKESMSIDELRRIIAEQISNLPKNYAFFSKEGWPLTKSQECKLRFCNLVNKRNIVCIRKVYDKPRIGVLTDSGEYLGSIFTNYDCTLSDLRRILDDIFRDSENSSKLAKFMDYRFIDRNEWPVVRSHEDQLTLLDILVNQNILLRPNLSGSFTSSCPAIKDARGDSNVGLEIDGKLTSLGKQVVTTPTSTDDRMDSWKVDTWRRSSKKRNIMRRTTFRRNRPMIELKVSKKNKSTGKTIMISYCRQEAYQYAIDLKAELVSNGYSVYLDKDEIRTGTDWADDLNEAVKNCEVFIPLITQLYGRTQWTNREVKLADLLNKKIIPINFLDHWPPECLAIQFATMQCKPWKPVDVDYEPERNSSIEDGKVWPRPWLKALVKEICKEIPRDTESNFKPCEPTDHRLIAISAHPTQAALVNKIKTFLGQHDLHVWTSIEITEECDLTPMTPSYLPTIEEGVHESSFNEGLWTHNTHGGRNKRPVSLPVDPNIDFAHKKKPVQRQTSTVSAQQSIGPEKLEKFKEFHSKVRNAGAVIIIASKAYFNSKTSQQHVYYCEQRKPMILVRAEDVSPPPWFSNFHRDELPLDVNSPCFLEVLKGRINRILDPCAKTDAWELQEAKIQYLLNYMKKNLPDLDTCVYIIGSTSVTSQRTELLCKAIGKELTKVDGLTVVTCGFYGASHLLAKSFFDEKSKQEAPKNRKAYANQFQSSVVHVLPLKDASDFSDKCKQLDDGSFQSLSYGETLFLGESMKERDTAIARLLDTCILIEGGPEAAREAQEFIWNDHYVIPISSTGGAASGKYYLPRKVFDKPHVVDQGDWKMLEDREATPEEVAQTTIQIIMKIKESISLQRMVQNATKTKVKGRSFRRTINRTEKVETDVTLISKKVITSEEETSKRVLPVKTSLPMKTSKSRWHRFSSFISFASHRC
uniref:TIR domain-containing protein n=2 Tax=Tetranychus urticae TaxID=32264 RepID=T1KE61_TETUR